MREHSLYRRIIAPGAGAWSRPVCGLLRAAEAVYAAGVTLRNRRYDRPGTCITLPVPVISVGNLTVGGTGKTPFVIELARRLDRMGKSPAVVSRGYRSMHDTPNDEERLILKRCAGVVYVTDPDRVAGAQRAHEVLGADVIVLDDGFQHRRLDRTLDVVLIDATCPFGFGHLLPRGLLREPVASLRRADVAVLSRCDQVSPAALTRLDAGVRTLAPNATHLQCLHRVAAIERLDGAPWEGTDNPVALSGEAWRCSGRGLPDLEDKRAVLFAAIAQPASFAASMRTLGLDVVATRWWPDHHEYTLRDLDSLFRTRRFPAHDLLITTEKDAVKLVELDGLDPSRIHVARIDIDFVRDGGTVLQAVLNETVNLV